MEGSYNLYRPGASGWTAFMNNREFNEEDVWAVLDDRINLNSDFIKSRTRSNSKFGSYDPSPITTRQVPTAAQMIPRSTNDSTQEPKLVQQSAPINVPDWSKIYGTSVRQPSSKLSRAVSFHGEDSEGRVKHGWDSDEDDDDNDDERLDGKMMPPHEWIAKKLARTQIPSFSVCEGAGRTLKGRDLSRVRNAVLTRTGFLE